MPALRLASHLRAEDFSTSSFVMGPLLLMRHPPLSSFLSSRFSGSPPSKKSPSSDFLIEIFRHGHEEDSLDRQEKILDSAYKRLMLQMFGPQSSERERKMDLLIAGALSACPTIYVTLVWQCCGHLGG